MKVRRLICALLAVLLLAPAMSGCGGEQQEGGSFRFPLEAEPQQIDPQVSLDRPSITLVAAIFEGLTRLDQNGKAVPGAADWTVSGDGLTYTFTLKPSKWSNGDPVTAADFVFGMQRAVAPSTRSGLAERLFVIAGAREVNAGAKSPDELGVKAVDERTLVIQLEKPNPDFPRMLSDTPFMPCQKAFFEASGGRYGLEPEYILSNGPFTIRRWNHGESILLQKHEGYHGADAIKPASVRYVILPADTDTAAALREGRLDAALLPTDVAVAARDSRDFRQEVLEDTVSFLWFNTSLPELASVKLRRALRDGLEWPAIWEQLDTAWQQPATGYLPPDTVVSGDVLYRRPEGALPFKTSQSARSEFFAALKEMGYSSPPALTLLTADDPASERLAQYVAQSWQKHLSLYVAIEKVPADALASRVTVGNYQLAIYAFTPRNRNAGEALAAFALSAEEGNFSRYSDAAYLEACRRLASDATPEKVLAVEKMLYDACPAVPLSFVSRFFGVSNSVTGLVVRPFAGGVFGAELDFRQAKRVE